MQNSCLLHTSLGLAMLVASLAMPLHAAVLTVDNNPSNNAQYSTWASAYAAAVNDDTLLIQPSATSYGNITIGKRLTVIGRGHNPANDLQTTTGSVTINAGGSGSLLEGVFATGTTISGTDITVRNCYLRNVVISASASNTTLLGNVINNPTTAPQTLLNINTDAGSLFFLNNHITQPSGGSTQVVVSGGNELTLFRNNIIFKGSTSGPIFSNVGPNVIFADNVFYANTVAQFNPSSDCSQCQFQNNLSFSGDGTLELMPGNNLDNVQPTWNFGGLPTFNYNRNFNMLSGAPSTGATDGGQVGVFGDGYDFDVNGHPRNVPRMLSTTILTPYVPQGGNVEVNFEAEQGQP